MAVSRSKLLPWRDIPQEKGRRHPVAKMDPHSEAAGGLGGKSVWQPRKEFYCILYSYSLFKEPVHIAPVFPCFFSAQHSVEQEKGSWHEDCRKSFAGTAVFSLQIRSGSG